MTMYLAGVPENKLENSEVEDTVKYSNVVLTARQYMKAALEGDSQTPVLSGVFETFRTSVMEYYEKKYPGSEAVRTGVRNLLEGLEARCVKQMNWAGMEWWRGKTQGFLLWFPTLMGGAVLVAGLGTDLSEPLQLPGGKENRRQSCRRFYQPGKHRTSDWKIWRNRDCLGKTLLHERICPKYVSPGRIQCPYDRNHGLLSCSYDFLYIQMYQVPKMKWERMA